MTKELEIEFNFKDVEGAMINLFKIDNVDNVCFTEINYDLDLTKYIEKSDNRYYIPVPKDWILYINNRQKVNIKNLKDDKSYFSKVLYSSNIDFIIDENNDYKLLVNIRRFSNEPNHFHFILNIKLIGKNKDDYNELINLFKKVILTSEFKITYIIE